MVTHLSFHRFGQQITLEVASWLVAADVRIAQFEHHRADVRVFEFDGTLAAHSQSMQQLTTVRGLAVGLAGQLLQQHGQVVGHDQLDLFALPIVTRLGT